MSHSAGTTNVELDESLPPTEHQSDPFPQPTNLDRIAEASLIADSGAPDGGYGWVVISGCSVITWWFVGTSYCWGVVQAALVDRKLSSPSTLSFVGSMTCAFIAVLAIVNARVIRAIGSRNTGLLGISFLGLGQVLSGFSTHNVGVLFLTTGILMGVGTSLCFMVVSVTPAQYFNKKRGLANGIVFAAGGLGGAVISFTMDGLIQKVGPAWTLRILGSAVLITGLPAAWVIKERTPIRSTVFIDWSLFRDARFIILFLAGAIGTFPLFVPPFFLPLYAASLSLSSSSGAGLVAGFNFSSAVGRLSCGAMADLIGPLNTLLLSLAVSAGSMLVLWPISNSVGPLIAFVIINGAANGGFFATMPTVVGNIFGSARVSIAMGMVVTGWAGGYLLGAPIAGYLLNAYGGQHGTLMAYHPAIFYAGSMASGAAILIGGLKMRSNKNPLKKL